jgi:hypothetical protein
MTIPNGWLDATPEAWRLDEEREQFEITFRTEHGTIRWWGKFTTDNARTYAENQMKRCGWDGDWDRLDLKSEPVRIMVQERTHNGKTKQEVASVAGKGSSGAQPPKDPVKAASFIARMKGGAAPSGGDPFASAPQWNGEGREPGDASEMDGAGDTSFP